MSEKTPAAKNTFELPATENATAEPFGRHGLSLVGKAGVALGRRLPAGVAGLKLSGLARPLAYAGLKDGVADIELYGMRLRLHPKDNLCEKRLLLTPQCFDVEELAALRDAMAPGKIFIDIGANAGAYSLVAAQAGGGSSRVIAVEPQREMRKRLAYNAAINNFSNIEISDVALSDYEGESVMRIVGENKGRSALAKDDDASGDAVRVTTLQTLLSERNVLRLDAMKIDVEGGEARILSHYFKNVDRALWPSLIIMERPQVNRIGRAENAVALACARGYALRLETRLNAILDLKSETPA